MHQAGTLPIQERHAPHIPYAPDWGSAEEAAAVFGRLAARPALVTAASCAALMRELGAVADGAGFVVQAGDCAERFADATADSMTRRVRLLEHAAGVIESVTGVSTTGIGRFAGQYAKPRSQPTETLADGSVLEAYRGDAVNDLAPRAQARRPDVGRLLLAYEHSAKSLEFLGRAAAPSAPSASAPGPVSESSPRPPSSPRAVHAGHEALLLDYEGALKRPAGGGREYGSSGHFLWAGERTRRPDGPHVEFLRGITNPVGVKVGPAAEAADIRRIVESLAGGHPRGRLSLITRMGPDIGERLPALLAGLGGLAGEVLWICDPMHGNNRVNRYGQKTRVVSEIVAEVRTFFRALRSHGLDGQGIHLETTPEPVTECVETADGLDQHLVHYRTACDPRLNEAQVEQVMQACAEEMRS